MIIEDFEIKPDKESVLRSLGLSEGSEAYDTLSRSFDELAPKIISAAGAYAAAAFDGSKVYCAVTAGEEISGFSKSLFDSGEAVKGLLSDAIADEYLFQADKILSEQIKAACAARGLGVKKRLCAPDDFPLSTQETIIEKAGAERISVTEAFMLSPVKSMAYILELTDDKDVFNAQHDCSKCPSESCTRRSAPYAGEIVSSYSYTAVGNADNIVCVDIGTTTIAMEYIASGTIKKTYKAVNPQRRFGADVLSRIDAANRGRENELNSLIRFALKKGVSAATEGRTPFKIIAACNTTMTHLLMNYPCDTLGAYPFKSEHLNTIKTELDGVSAIVIGGISAFVGGDIVSGLYMTDFDLSEKTNIFIDLGTNGEMAVGNRNGIIATSAAAGPAFEGGRLSFAASGTDVIDIMARLLDMGIMDNTGLLKEKYLKKGYKINEKITVTQQDIREIQTAKAAVRAGVECLINAYGVSYDDIDTVYLAGGMGYGLSAVSAVKIGLLPAELTGKIKPVGNASLGGAVKYACENGVDRVENIRRISRVFPLASHKDFQNLYVGYMNFNV